MDSPCGISLETPSEARFIKEGGGGGAGCPEKEYIEAPSLKEGGGGGAGCPRKERWGTSSEASSLKEEGGGAGGEESGLYERREISRNLNSDSTNL